MGNVNIRAGGGGVNIWEGILTIPATVSLMANRMLPTKPTSSKQNWGDLRNLRLPGTQAKLERVLQG